MVVKTRETLIALLLFGFLLGKGQSNLFLKHFSSSASIYSLNCVGWPAVDTFSKNSFYGCASYWRSPINWMDTLVYDGYLTKIEKSGLTKWVRKYWLYKNRIYLLGIKTLKDKNILLTGATELIYNPNQELRNGLLIKTDSNGVVIWSRQYKNQQILNALSMSNGDIALYSIDSNYYSRFILLNSQGNIKWSKRQSYNSIAGSLFINITEGENKKILYTGFIPGAPYRGCLILIDSMGNKIKDIIMSNTFNYHSGYYIATRSSGGGFYTSGVALNQDTLYVANLLRVDNDLNIIWNKNYNESGRNCELLDVSELNPNNFMGLVLDYDHGYLPDLHRVGRMFFDSSGVIRKTHLFTTDTFPVVGLRAINIGQSNHVFSGMTGTSLHYYGMIDTVNYFCTQTTVTYQPTSNTEIYTYNNYNLQNSSLTYTVPQIYMYDAFDITADYYCSTGPNAPFEQTLTPVGQIEQEYPTKFEKQKMIFFPNPANQYCVLKLADESRFNTLVFATITIYDDKGRAVKEIKNGANSVMTISTNDLINGIYFLIINLTDGERESLKIIVQH